VAQLDLLAAGSSAIPGGIHLPQGPISKLRVDLQNAANALRGQGDAS
jgi:hypothetical protein